ncbi:MAG: transposase [Candidatus Brocadia sp.]|nr:transposase [Candidatus Brocadia sp.]UJS17502.1 MAG: transposase [Candidatus Jettenia sp.]
MLYVFQSKRFEIEVYAYVLMNNHYYLLLKAKKSDISQGMQWFGTTYTRRHNIKHSEKPDVEIPQNGTY